MLISDCDGQGRVVAALEQAFGWMYSPHAAAWGRRVADEMGSPPTLNEVMMLSVAVVVKQTV